MFSPLKNEVIQSLIEIIEINSDDNNFINHEFNIYRIFEPKVNKTCGCLIGTASSVKQEKIIILELFVSIQCPLWDFIISNMSRAEFNWLFDPCKLVNIKYFKRNSNLTPQHEDRHKAVARLKKYLAYKLRKRDLFDMYEVCRRQEGNWMVSEVCKV